MRSRNIAGLCFALIASFVVTAPAFAQYYYPNSVVVNPAYGPVYSSPYTSSYYEPCYFNYDYRGYSPYYGYSRYRTQRNAALGAAIGAGVGAAVGLMASHRRHYYF